MGREWGSGDAARGASLGDLRIPRRVSASNPLLHQHFALHYRTSPQTYHRMFGPMMQQLGNNVGNWA
ncbi:hypothetical protein QN277_006217 [Acacia crassicarpa]|uniref:Uncharacterized protein n=1 Tax=Acacia crassicarpa TaxID=499986 RepID=A0AAE1JYL8_9FABA|nr:hypothetical protein QN277_006217 [Acacia crassicarpa]